MELGHLKLAGLTPAFFNNLTGRGYLCTTDTIVRLSSLTLYNNTPQNFIAFLMLFFFKNFSI